MCLYDSTKLPLSKNNQLRAVQIKILKDESLSFKDKLIAGRDKTIKQIGDYKLKPNCAYRAINESLYKKYLECGFVIGMGPEDEYIEEEINGNIYNNNRGVDWYLGGVALKYGNIVIECPAYKNYFKLASDNGCLLAFDPTVRFIKSSGFKNPVPISLITNVFDMRVKSNYNNENKNKNR